MRLPEESTSIYDDEQRAALACLRFVRVSPGKVRDYELRDILTEYLDRQVGQDAGSARSSANLIPGEAWAWVNDLFGFSCLLRDDSASSDADKGLDVVYTDPKSRLVIDLLVADAFPEDSNVRFNIATFAEGVHVESYAESGVLEKRLHFVFKPIDIDQKRWRDHAAQLLEREKLAVAETSLPVRTLEEIAALRGDRQHDRHREHRQELRRPGEMGDEEPGQRRAGEPAERPRPGLLRRSLRSPGC